MLLLPWIILVASCAAIVGTVYIVEKCYLYFKQRNKHANAEQDAEMPIITPYVLQS